MSRVAISNPLAGARPAGTIAAVGAFAGPTEDLLRLSDFVAAARRNWRRIALSMLTALLLAILYLMFATPLYTSGVQFFVDPRGRNTVDAQVVPSGLGSDVVLMESQAKILQSYAVLDRVVRQEKLDRDPEFMRSRWPGFVTAILAVVGGGRRELTDDDSRRQVALDALVRRFTVRRTSNTYIIDAEVTTEDPVKSARIMTAIAASYLSDQSGAKSEEARRLNTAIDGRLQELRDALRTAENRAEEFRRQAGLLQAEGNLVNEQQTTRLNGALVAAQGTTADAQARFERIQRAIKQGGAFEAIPEAVGSQAIQSLRSLYARAAQREASLSSRLRPGHPELADAQSQLASVRSQIVAELQRIASATQSELQVAQQRENQIKRNLDESMQELTRKHQDRIKLAELEREAASSRRVLETYLGRAKETKEQQSLYAPEGRIISPPVVNQRPSKPNKPVVLAASLLAGLGAGVLWSILASQSAEASSRPARVAPGGAPIAPPGLRVLATIPSLRTGRGRLRGTGEDTPFPGFARVCDTVSNIGANGTAAFWSGVLRLSDEVTGIEASGGNRVCMLVGAQAQAGVSTTALAMAMSESMAGVRVLLVDAACDKADLSAVFASGATLPSGGSQIGIDELRALISQDAASGLSFLPLANAVSKPPRRLRPATAAGLLKSIGKDYDLVVIDGGSGADARLTRPLIEIADQIVVVDAGSAPSAQGEAVARSVGLDGPRTGGLVLSAI